MEIAERKGTGYIHERRWRKSVWDSSPVKLKPVYGAVRAGLKQLINSAGPKETGIVLCLLKGWCLGNPHSLIQPCDRNQLKPEAPLV